MERKHRELINHLLAYNANSLELVTDKFNISKDELLQDIEYINNELDNGFISVIENNVEINDVAYDELSNILLGSKSVERGSFEISTRVKYIVLIISTESKHTLQSISDKLFVSKNTIYNDMIRLKEMLPSNLQLQCDRKYGYYISGPENIIINFMIENIMLLVKFNECRQRLLDIFNISKEDRSSTNSIVSSLEEIFDIKLTDEKINQMPYIVPMILRRMQSSEIHKDVIPFSFDLDSKWEVETSQVVSTLFPDLSKFDAEYFILWFLSLNVVNMNIDTNMLSNIENSVFDFIKSVEEKTAITIKNVEQLKVELLQHIIPAIYRQYLDIRVENYLTSSFKQNYNLLFNIVAGSINIVEKYTPSRFSDDELAYIAMIILGRIHDSRGQDNQVITAIILCMNGTSISKYMLESLRLLFPSIYFLGTSSFRDLDLDNTFVDLIFSTHPFTSKIPTIVVSPELIEINKEGLIKEVTNVLESNQDIHIDKLITSLSPFLKKDEINFAKETLANTLKGIQIEKFKALPSAIDSNKISFVTEQISWSEVVDFCFSPLLERGNITEEYIEAVYKSFYNDYTYMIIGPNIYMPHAKPEFGVIKSDYEVFYFNKPIKTPNNTEINFIVALAPGFENEHLAVISELNTIFTKSEFTPGNNESNTKKSLQRYMRGEN